MGNNQSSDNDAYYSNNKNSRFNQSTRLYDQNNENYRYSRGRSGSRQRQTRQYRQSRRNYTPNDQSYRSSYRNTGGQESSQGCSDTCKNICKILAVLALIALIVFLTLFFIRNHNAASNHSKPQGPSNGDDLDNYVFDYIARQQRDQANNGNKISTPYNSNGNLIRQNDEPNGVTYPSNFGSNNNEIIPIRTLPNEVQALPYDGRTQLVNVQNEMNSNPSVTNAQNTYASQYTPVPEPFNTVPFDMPNAVAPIAV